MTHHFKDVPPGRGQWIRPGTDHATIGREIVGNAMREFLARHPEESAMSTTNDAQAQRDKARQDFLDARYGRQKIEDAYQAAMDRKVNASKPLSEDARSSYRRDLGTNDAQAKRDAARDEFLNRRYGRDIASGDPIEAAYQRKMARITGDSQ